MSNDYGTFKRSEYPKEMIALARKRVAGLLKYNILQTCELAKLLESAYLQGIVDAAEALPEKEPK